MSNISTYSFRVYLLTALLTVFLRHWQEYQGDVRAGRLYRGDTGDQEWSREQCCGNLREFWSRLEDKTIRRTRDQHKRDGKLSRPDWSSRSRVCRRLCEVEEYLRSVV